jgi:hypothetical protein
MTAKSNKLTDRDFENIKSGQTFWRTIFLYRRDRLMAHVDKRRIAGKRVGENHKSQKGRTYKQQFICKDSHKSMNTSYISDMKGHGCFWTQRACEKFVADVLAGRASADLKKKINNHHASVLRTETLVKSYSRREKF